MCSIFGYIAGRISYTKKCQEKMLALPNSRFAEMLRRNMQRRQGNNWDLSQHDAGAATALSLAPFQGATDGYTNEYNQVNIFSISMLRIGFLHTIQMNIPAEFIEFGYRPTALFGIGGIHTNDGRFK